MNLSILSILKMNKKTVFLLPILSGIFLILAYPPYNLGFLVWVSLVPLFYFLTLKSVSGEKSFIGGFITGFLFFGKLFDWFFATAPFEWLGVSSQKALFLMYVLVFLVWFFQTVFLSLFFGTFAWIFKKLSEKKFSLIQYLITIPCIWIILEYLRAWGFGFFWIGKESLIGPHWTFGNLAYSLHNSANLIQLASFVGIYGISFLIIVINVALFLYFRNHKEKKILILMIFLILISFIWSGYGFQSLKNEEKGEQREIAFLQTNFLSGSDFNPYQKKEVFKSILDLFQLPESIEASPDFVVSPEGFGVVSITQDKDIAKHLLENFWQPGQIFLENQKIADENQKTKSRLFYYDLDKEKPIGYHDKMLLVPGGDYLPYTVKSLMSIYSFNIDFEKKLYTKGEKIEPIKTEKGIVGGTICSSVLSPNINREITKKGAEFLAIVSSDAPFHGAETLLAQNLAMSKLRAVENRRYFVQATNMGYSFLINPKGEIVLKSSELGNKIFFSNIKLINKKTFYTKFGDLIICIAFILVLITLLLLHRKTFLDFLKNVIITSER